MADVRLEDDDVGPLTLEQLVAVREYSAEPPATLIVLRMFATLDERDAEIGRLRARLESQAERFHAAQTLHIPPVLRAYIRWRGERNAAFLASGSGALHRWLWSLAKDAPLLDDRELLLELRAYENEKASDDV